MLGTSSGMVSMLETGKRRLNIDWTTRLAKIFKCSQADIWETEASLDQRSLDFIREIKERYSDDEVLFPLVKTFEALFAERLRLDANVSDHKKRLDSLKK